MLYIVQRQVGQPTWEHVADQMAGALLAASLFSLLAWPLERLVATRAQGLVKKLNRELGFSGAEPDPLVWSLATGGTILLFAMNQPYR